MSSKGHGCGAMKLYAISDLHVGFDANRSLWTGLRDHPDDRARYAEAKRTSADVSNAAGEAVMHYNLRKQPVVREILDRMFRAHGMLPADG